MLTSVQDEDTKLEAHVKGLHELSKSVEFEVALAAAGVITGTSLSSLGALGLGWRLLAAVGALSIGILGLGWLCSAALNVIVPLDYTLQQIANMNSKEIEAAVKPILNAPIQDLKQFCDYLRHPKRPDESDLSNDEYVSLHKTRRLVETEAYAALRLLLFDKLKYKTFALMPIIVAAFVGFSWAANPAKLSEVPAVEKSVEVNPNDVATLQTALGGPACVVAKLPVIVVGEWPSGVQDVVTVPRASCPPMRLRLDNGRFSQTH
jgi:hypothetical protein